MSLSIFELIDSTVAWGQLVFSVFFTAIFLRNIINDLDALLPVVSNIIALGGCVLLVIHAFVQPPGMILMALVMGLSVSSVMLHLVAVVWDWWPV